MIYPRYVSAERAFVHLFTKIDLEGLDPGNGTKSLSNVGFYIDSPLDNLIDVEWRQWSHSYALREWKWYLSRNRSVEEIKKFAPIWDKMHGGDNIVNSNYGWQWNRENQLEKCIEKLKSDPSTRQAWISIFDGKEKSEYDHDTPCTLNVGFSIRNGNLNMTVLMRSNDLWYGFCNNQYCFSNLQKLVAKRLDLDVGWYFHYANDMHIYKKHYGANYKFYKK